MTMATRESKKVAIFTICSNNYLPFARVLLESAHTHHPEVDLFLCLADRASDTPGFYHDNWTVISAENLAIPDFHNFAFRYDVMEFNTALKPFMFQYLLEKMGYESVLYFDPDIIIFSSLEKIIGSLSNGSSFYLTPHLCSPSEGEVEPNDITIMRAGIYNLGFLGMSNTDEALRILAWWARRLRYQCINAQAEGIFVDQKFIDMVPGFARNVDISHDTTMNVAYWNLPQRKIEQTESGWTVDDTPITFFHFSGFNPHRLDKLSKHDTRFSDKISKPLDSIMKYYANRLFSNGYGSISGDSYAYGKFESGTLVHHFIRKMFRERHEIWPDDPFKTYEAFLHEPWPNAARPDAAYAVTNFMKYLYDILPPLGQKLELSNPDHVKQLVTWYVNSAATDLHLDLPLVEPIAKRIGTLRRPLAVPPDDKRKENADVSVIGYLRTSSGVGEVGRQTILSLNEGGVQTEGVDVSLGVAGERADVSCEKFLTDVATAPIQIFNINADQLPVVFNHLKARLRESSFRISIPFWELSQFPSDWLGAFSLVHEIWAPSQFIQTALAGRTDRPVIHMPVAFELDPVAPRSRQHFGLSENKFLFFFAFDFLSFMQRKNPHAAIKAFRMAFPKRGQAGLVLKCMNGDRAPEQRALLLAEIDGDPNITLIDKTLNRADTLSLIDACDAILSLHRSEGLGLLIAEGMLLRKPVVATNYSASKEFLSEQTGYPVDFHVVPVKEGEYPFFDGQLWAEPDVAHAAWLMRRLSEDPSRADLVKARAFNHLQKNYSRRRVAAAQKQRLQVLGIS